MKVDLDFAVSYRLGNKQGKGKGGNNAVAITVLIILITIFIIAVIGFFVFLNASNAKYIENMNLDLVEYDAEKAKIAENQKTLDEISKKATTINEVNANIAKHRMVSKPEILEILNCLSDGVKIGSIYYMDSVILISCSTMDVYAPSNSADALNEAGISSKVEYTGFTFEDESEEDEDGEKIIVQYDPNEPKTYNFVLTSYLEAPKGGN